MDFAKPKHKRLLEIDDNFDNFSFEEVNAVSNPTIINSVLYVEHDNEFLKNLFLPIIRIQSGPKGQRRSGDRRARRRSIGSHHYGTPLGGSISEGIYHFYLNIFAFTASHL